MVISGSIFVGKWVDISNHNLLWVVVVVFVANEKSSMGRHIIMIVMQALVCAVLHVICF